MKKHFIRTVATLLVVVLTLTAAPLSGFVGLDFPEFNYDNIFSKEAEAATITSYNRGDIIEFGWYPQSEVTDSATIAALNAAGDEWISYNYYSGTDDELDGNMTVSDYMRYKDVLLGGNKYRGVVFDSYRPHYTGSTSSAVNSEQDNNGYSTNTVYWFQYEPIQWRVLDPVTGMVMSETILDSQPYNNYVLKNGTDEYGTTACWGDAAKTHYANNYEKSSIRAWLNADFCYTAFSAVQQNIIASTTLDNSAYSDSYSAYDSASSNDQIYLLSRDDALNTAYGFSSYIYDLDTARQAQGSAYAKCQGLDVDSGNGGNGNSSWLLRSAAHISCYCCYVFDNGEIGHYCFANYTDHGVRPAFNFNLTSAIFQSKVEDLGNGNNSMIAYGPCGEYLTWNLYSDGTLIIDGFGDMTNYMYYKGLNNPAPWYDYLDSIKRVIIEDGVTSIGSCAFDGCVNLTSVTIPNTVTSFGSYAFCNCTSLTEIDIPDSVTELGQRVFMNAGLKTVTVPGNIESQSRQLYMDCTQLTTAVLSEGLTTINYRFFDNCDSLTTVYLPKSLSVIEMNAFDCCENITDIYYSGSKESWELITIGDDNEELTNATIHYNYSGATFSQPIYMASIWSGIHDEEDSETPESDMLDWLHGKINQNDVAYTPICGIITESLQNNSTYQTALQAWEDVQTIASPSYQIDKYSSLNDIYIGIILSSVMNVLESDSFEELLNGKIESDTLDWTKTISSIAKELYGIDDYAAYFKDSKTASDFKQKNSDIVVKAYEKRAGKQMNAEFVSETTGFVSEMINIANNASEFLAKLTAFMAIAETRDSLKQLLNDLAKNTNIIKNGSIMSNALELVSAATENGLTAAMTAVCDMLLHDGVLMISSEIINKAWEYAGKAFPFLKGVQIGAKIGTAICNAFMATEDSIVAYYTAKATYEFYEILQEACGRNESAYLNTTTEETSAVYLDAERLYVAALQLDLINGLKYFDIACNQGLVNVVNNWIDGGNANYESIKTSTESIGKSLSDFKTLLEISWIVGHSYLRTDYPEVFESYIKHILTGIPESTPNIYSIRVLPSGQLKIRFTGNIMLNATYPLLDGYEVYVKKNDGEFVLADEIYSYKPRFWSQKIEFSNTDYYTVKLRSFVDTADEGRIYSSFSNEMSILANPAMAPVIEVAPFSSFYPELKILNLTDRSGFEADDLVETVIYRRAEGEETAVEIARLPLLPLRSDVNNQTYTDTTAISGKKYYYSAQTHIQTAMGTHAGKIYKSELSDEVIVSTKSYGRPSLTVRNSAGGMDLSNTFGTTTINESSVISNCVQMYTKSTVYDSSLSFTNGNEVKDDTGITLSWDRISNCDQIYIYKKYEYADKFILAAQINGNLTTYTDNAVSAGSTYEYCIAIYQTEDGNSVFCGASDPVKISTPEKARITWVAGDQFIVEYVTVGNSIVIPEFNLGNSEIIGWSSEIPKTVSAGTYTFTAILSGIVNLGDTNSDGTINGKDLVRLRKYLADYNESTGTSTIEISSGGDVTGDGAVNGKDLVRLRKYLANYNEETGESTVVLG